MHGWYVLALSIAMKIILLFFSKFYFKCDLNNFKYNFDNSL